MASKNTKPIYKSRTNITVAAIVTVVVTKALSHYLPADLAAQLAPMLTDEVVALTVAVGGALAIKFRQLANKPTDEQGKVTPRPS